MAKKTTKNAAEAQMLPAGYVPELKTVYKEQIVRALRIEKLDIGNVDTSLFLYDTALRCLCIRFGMSADNIDTLDNDTILVCNHREDFSCLAFIITGINKYGIAFLYVKLFHTS